MPTGYRDYSLLSFLNLLMQRSSLKFYKNVHEKRAFLKMRTLSFCIIWVILRKLSAIEYANFSSKNVLRTEFYQIELLDAFIFIIFQCQNSLVSNKNSLEMTEIGKISSFCGQF